MDVMDMDSFAADDSLFGGVSAEGGFPTGRGRSYDDDDLDRGVFHVPFVTPLASPLVHRPIMAEQFTYKHIDDRTHASDRTLASFGAATIMSVGSQSGDHSLLAGDPRKMNHSSVFSDFHSGMNLGDQSLHSAGQRRTSSSSVFSDIHSVMNLADHSLHSGGPRRTSGSSFFSDIHSGMNLGDHSLHSGGPRRTSGSSVFSDIHSGILSVGEDFPPRIAFASFASSRHEVMNSMHSLSSDLKPSGDVPMTEHSGLVDSWMPPLVEPGFPAGNTIINNKNCRNGSQDSFPVADLIASSSSFSDHFSNSLQVSGTMGAPSVVPTPTTYTPMNYNHRSEGKPSVIKSMKTKTKQRKEQGMVNGRQIRQLIAENGTQHVYFGRGEPIRNNPGNVRFRSIIDKYYGEYQRATKKVKLEIRNKIEDEVKSDGSKFIVVVETKGKVSQKLASDSKVKDGTGHALRDTPKRRANYWSWLDPSVDQPLWTTFANKDGAALEQMFQECPQARTTVPVTVRKQEHLVDVSSMIMNRVINGTSTGNDDNLIYHVRRLEPEEYSESGEQIDVSEGDGQYDARSSASQTSGASGTSSTGSSSRPAGGGGMFGGVQSSMYCSLGMANQGKDEEITVFAYEAGQDEIFEAITCALEEARDKEEDPALVPIQAPSMSVPTSGVFSRREARSGQDEDDDADASALQPPPRSTNLEAPSGGGLRSGLVKRLKNKVKFGSQISLNFGKKKEQSDADQNSTRQTQEVLWLWRETKSRMDRHGVDAIEGDPKDCWVRYDEASSALLEASYKTQNGSGECVASPKYTVDFGLMRQINIETGFQRQVRRIESTSITAPGSEHNTSTGKTVPGIAGKLNSSVRVHHADDMTLGEYTAPTSAEESTTVGLEEEMIFRRQPHVN